MDNKKIYELIFFIINNKNKDFIKDDSLKNDSTIIKDQLKKYMSYNINNVDIIYTNLKQYKQCNKILAKSIFELTEHNIFDSNITNNKKYYSINDEPFNTIFELIYEDFNIELLKEILHCFNYSLLEGQILEYATDFDNSNKPNFNFGKKERETEYTNFVTELIKYVLVSHKDNRETCIYTLYHIHFNTLIPKKNSFKILQLLEPYLKNKSSISETYYDVYNKLDKSGYSLLLDSARYNDLQSFKKIFYKTEENYYFLNKSRYLENILSFSIYNTDTRIFDFIVKNTNLVYLEQTVHIIKKNLADIIIKNRFNTKKIMFKLNQVYKIYPTSNLLSYLALSCCDFDLLKKIYAKLKFTVNLNDFSSFTLKNKNKKRFIFERIMEVPNNNYCLFSFLRCNLKNACLKDKYNYYIFNTKLSTSQYKNLLYENLNYIKDSDIYPCTLCKSQKECCEYNFKLFSKKLKNCVILEKEKNKLYLDAHPDYYYKDNVFIKNIFLYGIYNYINIGYWSYGKKNEYLESFQLLIKLLKKKIQLTNKKYKSQHKFNFNLCLYEIEMYS
jgi:hypothetical protein